MIAEHLTVMISSAGRRVSLLRAFRRAMVESGITGKVIASDASPLSAAMWDADSHHVVPRCSDPQYIPRMVDLCRTEQVSLLIPTIDTELEILSKSQDLFAAVGTRVVVSGPETIAIASDKVLTHRFLTENLLPTGRQAEVRKLPNDISSWAFPLIAKPRSGSASQGILHITSTSEITELSDDYVVEEIATGDEYTMDVYLDSSGRAAAVVPRRRLEVRAGEVSKGVTAKSPELIRLAQDVCDALPDAAGVLTIQAFHDQESGKSHVIEINPRFGGGYPLAHAAGADFPLWLVQEVVGLTPDLGNVDWTDGLMMLRFDDAVFLSLSQVRGPNV